ncbi:succinate dehydrogenase assembly factor 2 [Roseovarius sp. LXJ103]|uniref:succinate dehydrogenase assembly factor 2 n=1 Tax=Roseovarius carneus TaxID=2853164 RepID=UPI000D60FA9B|nr:succinate dehydrogenase assembly factor 2 [Roseovarius carneus]MBZ8118704.1 succinate dehydrogenase assembly factor 2 [Roseovarius carneus]PWE35617.1 succinate dehydrogenase assembly factor 2 [Pelagicola sp. LXJ1103]
MSDAGTGETREVRLRRLTMRSMRRGIKEMDIILSRFAAAQLDDMSAQELDIYDAFLEENDQDLYQWVTGQIEGPGAYDGLITRILSVPVSDHLG